LLDSFCVSRLNLAWKQRKFFSARDIRAKNRV